MEAFLILFSVISLGYISQRFNILFLNTLLVLTVLLFLIIIVLDPVLLVTKALSDFLGSNCVFDKITLCILPIISLISWVYLKNEDSINWKTSAALTSALLATLANNPIVFLLLFETASVFVFLISYTRDQGKFASLRFLKYSVFSFSALISAVVLNQKGFNEFASILVFVGIIAKAPLFPFTSWQVQAYSECRVESVVFMSSLLSKLPLLFLVRFGDFYQPNNLFVSISVLATFFAAFNVLKAKDLTSQLAFASAVHLALFFASANVDLKLSYQISSIFFLGHGIFLGYLIYLSRQREIQSISLAGLISVLALIGQPFSLIFWSDLGLLSILYNSSVWECFLSAFSLILLAWLGLNIISNSRIKLKLSSVDLFVLVIFFIGFWPNLIQPEVSGIEQHYKSNYLTEST